MRAARCTQLAMRSTHAQRTAHNAQHATHSPQPQFCGHGLIRIAPACLPWVRSVGSFRARRPAPQRVERCC
eukprot:6215547-Alexandrium_andersonii.AAC.1